MNVIHSKRIGALLAVLVAAAGCGGSSSSSSTVVAGVIRGAVKASSGSALAGVTVTAQGASVPAYVTGADGKYSLSVPPGSYTLRFTGDNLEPATASSGPVASGETVTMPDQVMAASALHVTVTLPPALQDGGPAGFDTTVTGITVSATLNGNPVTPDSVAWAIKDYDAVGSPPSAVTPEPATGTTTSFAIPDFETVREGANAWLNDRYGTAGTAEAFEYIQAPERDQLLSISAQQARSMSYTVQATVTSGGHTSTGSAHVYTTTLTNGGNTLPLGMSVIANAPSTATYAWTLQFLPMTATSATFADAPAGLLQGADTKNPYLVPTETGVYKLQNGEDDPLYFRVSTWHGVGKSDTDATGEDHVACASCHSGDYSLSEKFAEWSNSAHGNHNWKDPFATPMPLVQYELTDTSPGNHYGESCLECHTVGFSKVPSADNNGFDDIARADGWTFPTAYGEAAWATVADDPGLLHRASIQCENCHGPLETTEHSQPEGIPALFALPVSPVASMNAGVCMVCHDEFSHHDRGALWATSGHANTELAMDEATVESRGTTAAHCGRCHAGEGFVVYLAQQQAGNPGNIARPACTEGSANCSCSTPGNPATCFLDDTGYTAYLGNTVGLKKATVHSQTCQTCHDPHTTELRLDGDTGMTAASFDFKNAGAGALCMVCHNSRIGNAVFADSAKTSYSAPHQASQGDVFAGRNAYFYGSNAADADQADLPFKTVHAFMADTCADCHVNWVPSDVQAQFKPASTNHTFKATLAICAQCHGEGLGEKVVEQVEGKLATLGTKLSVLFAGKLNAGGTDSMVRYVVDETGAVTDATLADGAIAPGDVTRVSLTEIHGQPGLIVTLQDGTVFGSQVSKFMLSSAALFPGSAASGIPAKAFYNYLLIHGGAAGGVHNPSFVNGVLDATIARLNTVPAL